MTSAPDTQLAKARGAVLDQRRARHALGCVRAAKTHFTGKQQERFKDYCREAKKLPVRILASGLGQALAFLNARAAGNDGAGLRQLLDDLTAWVLLERLPTVAPSPPTKLFAGATPAADRRASAANGPTLLDVVIDGDALLMRRATDETLAYLAWLNRIAEGESEGQNHG